MFLDDREEETVLRDSSEICRIPWKGSVLSVRDNLRTCSATDLRNWRRWQNYPKLSWAKLLKKSEEYTPA